ncbi:MAG: FAD-dependent oxidoreductase [Gammaproteobacteria bacterium]|nr:FAD-dependent oxidoreductase [Gammaproteobacteria bacterium]
MALKENIAIIGSGISGLSCAHILGQHANVTLFESNSYFGGHTNTVSVPYQGEEHAIDTGFIVFNKRNYPKFTQLIEKLDVPYQNSEMSFSFSSKQYHLEYNGHNLRTLFSQKRNLLRPKFYGLLKDILRFNRDGKHYLYNDKKQDLTLKAYVDYHNYGEWFWRVYLLPMVASIWSSTPQTVENMPAKFILYFFDNHGMLSLNELPQWLTIKGGSQNYVKALLREFTGKALNNAHVSKVTRDLSGITVHIGSEQLHFDQVIFACHSDTALQLLANPSADEINILSTIPYQKNEVVLHTDAQIMPKRRNIWASWNYHASHEGLPTLTYYMNRLQALTIPNDFFVSVNMTSQVEPSLIIKRFEYAHPVFHELAIAAQSQFAKISGQNNTYFCGAYWFNGFHEDGVASAVRVCEQLGVSF